MASKDPKTVTAKTPAKPAPKPVAAKATPVAKPVEAKPVAEPFVSAPATFPDTIAPAPVVETKPVAPVAAEIEQPILAPAAEIEKAAETAVKAVTETIDPTPVAAPVLAAINKKVITMEATLKTATEKTQAYFAEANDRAKAAMEKSAKAFEDMNEFNKGNVEAFVESGKIAAKGIETLGQSAADYARKSFEGATATLKSLSSVKSPTDFFKLHSDYFRSSFDSMVAESSKTTEAVLKLAGEVAQPISNRVAVAVEKVKVAA
jgi:phasin family protein